MIQKTGRIAASAAALLAIGVASGGAAFSQTQTKNPAPAKQPATPIPALAATGGPSVATQGTAVVDGFRSAKFV